MVRLVKNTAKNYTNISNAVIRDERLSWKARGIFIYMWSQADNWNFYVSEIAKHSTDGEGALQSGLKELEKLGYLVRQHRQTKKGVFDGMEWVLTDHDPVKPIEGKIKEKAPKKSKNPSDGKTTEWKTHPVENSSLRNNNNKNYQQQEITKESNTNSASHSNAQSDTLAQQRREVIEYLNKKTDSKFKPNAKGNESVIDPRLKEGYTVDDMKMIIDAMYSKWHGNKFSNGSMGDDYLRPETLFRVSKIEGYLNIARKMKKQQKPDDMFDMGGWIRE